MKDIKYYLHLYIGCQAEFTSLGGGKNIMKLTGHDCDYQHADSKWYPKPILRPLSDMTEEEKMEYKAKFNGMDSTNILPEIRAGRLINFHLNSKSPYEVIYLLSKGFDLFGLIESGLAIDKTTL